MAAAVWDDVLARWIDSRDHLITPLHEWLNSYAGTGKGAVDLSHYPDPYVGDLRGGTHDVRLVVLGLNPGRGYPELQGRDGVWTQRIAAVGYSQCFDRSPAEDPESWITLHGKPSPYWRNLIAFGKRWTNDATFDVHGILNFELYPWHSDAVTAPIVPPASVIDQFIWQPCQEVETHAVFAFGAPWFQLCEALELPEAERWGGDGTPFPMEDDKGWRMRAYRLPSGQCAVVSSQPGFAGPPGPKRLGIMHDLLSDLFVEWDLPGLPPTTDKLPSNHVSAAPELPVAARQDDPVPNDPAYRRRMTLVLDMVAVLHRRGYQHLRIVPGMSGSGLYWRCTFTPAINVEPNPSQQGIDQVRNHDHLTAQWTNANEDDIFGTPEAQHMSPIELADLFTNTYPDILNASDWAYAGWYVEMLGSVDQNFFPIFYADHLSATDRLVPFVTDQPTEETPRLALPPPPRPTGSGTPDAASRAQQRMTWQPGQVTVTPPNKPPTPPTA
jgi:hypothetical protein